MRFRILFWLWLGGCLGGSPGASAQNIDRVHQYLDTLTAPGMHGRGYVQRGDSVAATWLADRFAAIGLRPMATDYYQSFRLPIQTFPGVVALGADGRTLALGNDFIAGAASAAGTGRGRVLAFDTALFEDADARARWQRRKLRGRVLLVHERHWQRRAALPDDLLRHLETVAAVVELCPKLTASLAPAPGPVPHLKVRTDAWPASARRVRWRVEATHQPAYPARNVIGYVPGTAQPDSFVVITAHYDHLGRMGSVYFPGANDNASGTSMLLELADHYARHPAPYGVFFMAFAAEEAGLVGSRHYTENPLFPLAQIRFLLNLDLLGTGEDGLMVVNGQVHPEAFGQLARLNTAGQYVPALKARGAAANSDHYFFSMRGVPAFFLYTLGGSSAYHDVHDRPEGLSLVGFEGAFRLILDFVENRVN